MLIATPSNTPADDSNALHGVDIISKKLELGVMLGMTKRMNLSLTSLSKNREVPRLHECLSTLRQIVLSDLAVDLPGTMPISAGQDLGASLERRQFPDRDGYKEVALTR